MTTLNLVITDKSDDGHAVDLIGVTQALDNSQATQLVMYDTSGAFIGLPAIIYPFWRFVSATIPQGATIN